MPRLAERGQLQRICRRPAEGEENPAIGLKELSEAVGGASRPGDRHTRRCVRDWPFPWPMLLVSRHRDFMVRGHHGAREIRDSGVSTVTSGKIVLKGSSLSILANFLSSQGLRHAVIDKTGLSLE